MGYVRQATLSLTFDEDTEFAGLKVRARRPSIRQVALWSMLGVEKTSVEEAKSELDQVVEMLADLLIEWNVEHEDGSPVPATIDGVWSQDAPFIGRILTEIMKARVEVPPPLAGSSPSGAPFPEVSIPMETSSPSQPN